MRVTMKNPLNVFIIYGLFIGNLFADSNPIQNGSFETGNRSPWNVGSPEEAAVSADPARVRTKTSVGHENDGYY
jgi:hypothetical protein